MKSIFHPSSTRGHNQFSWLDSYHSFSFGHFYDPEKIHFGALRVLNDDTVAPGGGFGTHPHDNMEIVSIPLQGVLEHKDSMGNIGVIKHGDVQIMSAGTGVQHSEYNQSQADTVKFLQIWVFPDTKNLTPGYDQKTFDPAERIGKWQTLVSPVEGEGVKIHQKSWFSVYKAAAAENFSYTLHGPTQGLYVFVLGGDVKVAGQTLTNRDAIGVWDTEAVEFSAEAGAEILAIEVPMEL